MDSDKSHIISENIYLVGASSPDLASLSQLLSQQGYVVQILDPVTALKKIRATPPELIILSHLENSAFWGGFHALMPLTPVPILIFPCEQDHFTPRQAYQMGCADYLSIPLQPEEAIARVEHQMMIVRLEKQLKHSLSASKEAESAIEDLEKQSPLDPITQVANYQRFQEYLEQQWRRGTRERILWADSEQSSISLIFCRLDNLGDYQDQHGQESAHQYLKEVAQALVRHIKRPSDLVARYSHDTFAILLPNTGNKGAVQVAHILYNAIKSIEQTTVISVGVATEIPTAALPLDLLLRNATQASLQASEAGGDRIVSTDPS